MPVSTPSLQQLQKALVIAEKIQSLEEELASLVGNRGLSSSTASKALAGGSGETRGVGSGNGRRGRTGKRVVSPEAREKIATAQRARWAKSNASAGPATAAKSKGAGRSGKRVVSAETRAKMAAAAKARHERKNGTTAKAANRNQAGKTKRVISPDARARIVAAVKARWARVKKAL
jgi:hypothetical protein